MIRSVPLHPFIGLEKMIEGKLHAATVLRVLPPATETDRQREAAIERATQRCIHSTKHADVRRHFREMCRLIRQRTPAQVARMERDRGLE